MKTKQTKKQKPANEEPKEQAPVITFDQIEIKGKVYDMAFDLVAFDLFTSRVKEYKLGPEFNTGHLVALIHAGIDTYAFMKAKPVELEFSALYEAVVEIGTTEEGCKKLFSILDTFMKCRVMVTHGALDKGLRQLMDVK